MANDKKSAKMHNTDMDTASDSIHIAEATTSNAQQRISKLDAVKHLISRLHPYAKLARPHIFALLAGIAFLATILMAFSTFLNGVSRNLESQLQVTRTESVALMDTNLRESILYSHLDKVLDTQLNNFTESYEDCLFRGLQTVDQQMFGLVYQKWDIVHKTFNWTLVNCGRLHRSPQLPQPTVQQAALTRWAQTSYRARRIAEKTLTPISHQVTSFRTWLSKHTGIQILEVPKPAEIETPRCCCISPPRYTDRMLPFGFILKCDQSSSCHLEYTPSVHEPSRKTEVTSYRIAKILRNLDGLRKYYDHIRLIQSFMPWVITPLLGLECFILLISAIAVLIFATIGPVETSMRAYNESLRHDLKDILPLLFFAAAHFAMVNLASCENEPKTRSPSHGDYDIVLAILVYMMLLAVAIVDPRPIRNAIKGLLRVSHDALADFRDPEKNPYLFVNGKVLSKSTWLTSSAEPLSPLAVVPIVLEGKTRAHYSTIATLSATSHVLKKRTRLTKNQATRHPTNQR
jgi:hypothetical protein